MQTRLLRNVLLSVVPYVLALCHAGAAEKAQLQGRIEDAQNRPVPNAQVKLFRSDLASPQSTITGSDGRYRFSDLAFGSYLLDVSKPQFRSTTANVRLDGGSPVDVSVHLELAGVNQSVVVTAADAAQTFDEVSKALSVISNDEIRNRDDYAFSDLLRTVTGVEVHNGGGPGQDTSVRVRGLRSDATAFLVDGLRFRDASTLQGDASSFVSTLNFVDTDHVEVLRGSGSSLYGTNAAGGAVNIVTDHGGGPLHGEVQVEGGNLGLFRTRGALAGGLWHDRFRYSAGLSHLNVTAGVDGQDANRSTGLQGYAAYDFSSRSSLSARFWGSDDFVQLNNSPTAFGVPDANIPPTGVVPAIPLLSGGHRALLAGLQPDFGSATYIPGVNDPDYRRASRFVNTAVIFRQRLTPKVLWQTSYQRVHTGRVYNNGPLGTGFQPSADSYSNYAGDIDTVDTRLIANPVSWMTLSGGYEFEREHYFDHQDNNLPVPSRVVERTDAQQLAHAVYFSSQLALLRRQLQISISGRAQSFRLSTPEFRYAGAMNTYAGQTLPDPPRALTGDASAAYFISRSNTKIRAHVGDAYRAPSLYERFGAGFYNDFTSGQVFFTPYGDPRLAPDRYNSADGGVDQYLFSNRLLLSGTFFYTRIVHISDFDFSGTIVTPATDPYGRASGYFNGSGGISRGIEVAAKARPLRSLSVSGGYTFTNADTDRDTVVPGYYRALGVPRHIAAAVLTKEWGRRFDTTLDLYRYSSRTAAFFTATGNRAFLFPGFTRTDAIGSYRFWQGEGKSARFYAKVNNWLNKTYYEEGFLAPGATYVLGVAYSF